MQAHRLAHPRLSAALASVVLASGCNSGPQVSASPQETRVRDASSDAAASNAGAPDCVLVERGHGTAGTVPIRAETVVSGLEVPWSMAFLPGGDVLVTERPGRVRLLRAGKLLPPIATLPIAGSSEGGLLGIAAHPEFAKTRNFYLYVTAPAEGGAKNRVERWRLGEDGTSAARVDVLLDGIPAAKNHDGGRLRFGPDGMLYIGTGDGQRPELSQDPQSPAGKILRIAPDGTVPKDNPTPGSRVFVSGIRNTQGFDWLDDRTLVVTDHGPSGEYMGRRGHDEVSVVRPGANLGWPTIYGCEQKPGMVRPSIVWETANPPGGAALYRGDAIPEWRGSLLMGSLRGEHLHRVALDATGRVTAHEVYLAGAFGRLREVIVGPDGQLYVTTSNCDGRGDCPADKDRILRIVRRDQALR